MIDPVAFRLGPFEVYWYGIIIASAFLIGIIGTSRWAKKAGISEDDWYMVAMILTIAAVLGARLYYIIFQWSYYREHLQEIPAVWNGGLAVHGGILLGLLALLLLSRYYGFSPWLAGDIIAPFLILGQALGRWGNYFNQEAYGYEVSPADVPWAMYIDGAYRHPTFLYESIWDFVGVFILLYIAKHHKKEDGDVALSYFMYYSLGRFVIEGFRTDSLMFGPLRMAQVMSLLLFVTALAVYLVRFYRRKHTKAL